MSTFTKHRSGCSHAHQVKPVISGYRRALTYDLVHTGLSAAPALQDLESQRNDSLSIFSRWKSGVTDEELSDRLIYLLDHKYTEANLRFSQLKVADRHRIALLSSAAGDTDFELFLYDVEKMINGSVEEGGYRYHRRGRWGCYNDYEDEYEGPHIMEDVFDESCEPTRVARLSGSSFARNVPVEVEEIIQADPFDRDFDDEDYEGFTGNMGASATHWYRNTGVVIVPKSSVQDFTVEKLDDVYGALRIELGKFEHQLPTGTQHEYIGRILRVALRKCFDGWGVDVKLPLDASLALCRNELFLQTLSGYKGTLDDRTLATIGAHAHRFNLTDFTRQVSHDAVYCGEDGMLRNADLTDLCTSMVRHLRVAPS